MFASILDKTTIDFYTFVRSYFIYFFFKKDSAGSDGVTYGFPAILECEVDQTHLS